MLKKKTINWLIKNLKKFKKFFPNILRTIPSGILNELNEELSNCPEYENIGNVIHCAIDGTSLKHCKTCGKLMTYTKSVIHDNDYCSYKCIDNKRRVERMKSIFIKKYGVENISQSDEIKEKKRQSSLERYGTENVFQNEEVKEKQKQTCIERYGVENVFQSEDIKKKSKDTCIEKYGTEYACQNDDVKKRIVKTSIQKYGTKNPAQSEFVKQKMARTCIERFGTDNIFREEGFRRRMLDRNYDIIKEKWKDYVIPLFSREEYVGHYLEEKVYKWKCAKCGHEFESKIYNTNHLKGIGEQIPRCLECYPICRSYSRKEKEMVDFVKSVCDSNVIENDRLLINPLELDVYIPCKNIAIEFDGSFWHSEKHGKGKEYHLMKTSQCLEKGVRLIHVFEHEWEDKRDIVMDRIKSALGLYDRKIYARKCHVREIGNKEANEFLNCNHLQSTGHSSIRLGLFHENELVSVMTFGKPRFNKNYDWEMIRFASSLGTQVIGGAGKLLSFFRKSHVGSIISYADRRYSDGRLYEAIGFRKIGTSSPNYWWINNQGSSLSRYQCQKHKLPALLGDAFDPSLSETANLEANGYFKLYDCGNYVFAMEK